ncbi:insulinase family protein [candidate division KSB1 bacterium]|nr:insulinase family protein [candidate division KSB1 bacterium]NIR70413.1 insulinase family protein [candidate division KSB1 bacterium]NIS25953.1 insulinase family protein [candidate division KSB1 bacterium]NIT69976.1 insulinase family protein [candidate division KSB1 bacterium]NIU26641.1 insulinase family protein [candidate division KSB1 bacterium]
MQSTETEFKKTTLENGIRVVTERIPYVRSVSIGTWLTVGSSYETDQTNGLSHFIEHMMFKGTRTRKAFEIAQSLESVGGHLNAFTGKEITCYYAHLLDEHLAIAIKILADILSNSIFDKQEMEKEKQVIIEELNALEETPEELIHDLFMSDLFPNHPLGYSIIGKRQNILNFKRQDIFQFLADHYSTERMVIAAAGNVDHRELVQLVETQFRRFHHSNTLKQIEPCDLRHGRNVIENGAIQAHICLGTQSYSYRNPKKFALLALNTLLGAGMSSRLFQNVREKYGLAYSVYSFIDFMYDTGLFGVYIGTDRQKIEDSIGLIQDELEGLTQEPVSDEELQRTKSQLKGSLMLGLESTASRMNRLARMEIYLNDYFTLDDTLEEIDNVTPNDVLEVANELFREDRIYTTVLKPGAVVKS